MWTITYLDKEYKEHTLTIGAPDYTKAYIEAVFILPDDIIITDVKESA